MSNKKPELSFDYFGSSGRFVSHSRKPVQLLDPTLPPFQRLTAFFLSLGEADHLPPSSAEVKNEWSCAYISPYASLAWDYINQ